MASNSATVIALVDAMGTPLPAKGRLPTCAERVARRAREANVPTFADQRGALAQCFHTLNVMVVHGFGQCEQQRPVDLCRRLYATTWCTKEVGALLL